MGILVCGLAVVDLVFAIDTIPTTPGKYRADDVAIVGGGCGANAAVAISRLGGQAMLVATVGDDLTGHMIVTGLEAEGVDCRLVQHRSGGRSPISSVVVDRFGERLIVNYRDRRPPDDTDWLSAVDPSIDAALVDTRWPAAGVAVLELARHLGVPGVVDAESPVATDVVTAASHVVFSTPGVCDFAGIADVEEALLAADRILPGWVAVTVGARGTIVVHEGAPLLLPAPSVQVVDTLGAGDVWHGAFTLALAEKRSEIDAVRFANIAAALKCTGFGGRAATPDRSTVEAMLVDPR